MKFTIDVECTPQEARSFLGLPDVEPMQKALLVDLQKRLQANLEMVDPEALFRTWLPGATKGWEELMKTFVAPLAGPSKETGGD